MDSKTIELVSNASNDLFPNNSLSYFTNLLTEQVNLEGAIKANCDFGDVLPINLPKNNGGEIQVL